MFYLNVHLIIYEKSTVKFLIASVDSLQHLGTVLRKNTHFCFLA